MAIDILLIEDETAHAELVRRAFEPLADTHCLAVAISLKEARQYLQEHPVDIVLTDWLLPDGKGTDLLPASPEERTFPVVVMTSHGDEHVAVDAMKAGALDYVVKSEESLRDMPHVVTRALREWEHLAERKRAEEQIRVSLREKELLLQEVHHRTRNNMQVISSLLHFQSAATQNEEALQAFQSIESRIRSMALVHDKLYQSDLTTVNLAEYIRDLAYSLINYYPGRQNNLTFTFDVEAVLLSIDSAVPCGLMLNELLTNTLQHAFPQSRSGEKPAADEIRIVLRPQDGNNFELHIHDNGVGLPENFDIETVTTLGFKLIKSIIGHQLKGTLELVRQERGTEIIAKLHPPTYKPRIRGHAV